MNAWSSSSQSLPVKTFIVMVLTVFSKLSGFLRSAVYAAVFGLTTQTDVFFMATNIYGVLSGFLTEGLRTSVIPLRTQLLQEKGRKEADLYVSALLMLAVILCLLLGIATALWAPFLVHIFAPNFTADQMALTVVFVRALSVLYIFTASVSALSGVLHSHQHFWSVSLLSLPFNFFSIACALLLGNRFGVHAMLCGFIFGIISQFLFLLPACRRLFTFRFTLHLNHPTVMKSLTMAFPLFISMYSEPINQAVSKAIASALPSGSISALNYSSQLTGLVTSILTVSVITTVFTALSRYAAENNIQKIKDLFLRAVTALSMILLPITALSMLYHREIVSIIFQRGSFDDTAASLTSYAFLFAALSFLPGAVNLSAMRCFHAQKNTKSPLLVSVSGMVVNIILSLLLIKPLQIGGIALANSLTVCGNAIFMLLLLRKKTGPLGLKSWVVDLCKSVASLTPLLLAVFVIKFYLPIPALFSFALATLVGGSCYLCVLWLLRQRDVRYGVGLVMRLINKSH